MTGVVDTQNGTRVAGLDRDSIVKETAELRQVTFISVERSPRGTRTATGELDLDCPKRSFQPVKLSIVREDGAQATILSRGPDWDTPKDATDVALLKAACSGDFSALADIHGIAAEDYAAGLLAGVDGHPR